MRDTEVRLVDGELWVRGPQVMRGYRNAPEATAEMLAPDGWLRTGDLVEIDARGDLYVRDRLRDLIKVNGLQVAPAELEALLLAHPAVADAAVVRRPHPRTGEVPVAVVVAREAVEPRALMAWVAERVAPHKRLAAVELAREIPRTPAGKILRRALYARA
jgi:acyl-CoA synthetase (AMP-forming)/AMP-acid ligase II